MSKLPAGHVPMTPLRTASCVLMIMFGIGLGAAAKDPVPNAGLELSVLLALLIGYLCLLWHRSDREACGYPRSPLTSLALVALPLAGVPYYLLRSRPAAERGRALRGYLGLLLMLPLAILAGAAVHLAIVHAFA